MEKSPLKPLISFNQRYEECYGTYCKLTNNVVVQEEWIKLYFPDKIIKEIKLEDDKELDVLGIGSGAGKDEINVLKQLLKRWPRVKDTVVEPHLSHINKYKDLVATEAKSLDGVSFEWRQQTVQQFIRDTKDQPLKKYHFIMLFHVMYFIEDLEDVLRNLKGILDDGGIILGMLECDDSCMAMTIRTFPQLKNSVQAASTKEIENAFKSNQLNYVKHRIHINLDATGCLDDESNEGELLIESLTQTAYLKKNVPKSLYSKIIEYLKSIILPNNSGDGKTLLRGDCDAIIITK
ncbi:histamine N-methyltransferase B-like [Antedon mediterranea]|uniref:histamine N-methyltransferase B-like n=1 Tax=Antedon mediterranea TaxID=105859 RepID=UPI003AF6E9F1